MEMKKLPEFVNITTGKLDANAAEEDGIYPYFTCGEIPAKINTYAFDAKAVMIAGNNAQGNFHVSRYTGKFNAYQRTYVLTSKNGSNLDYIYYSLKLALAQLKKRSQGSQTKFLTMPILSDIDINCSRNPDIIAAVLSSLDDKIALNNRINAKLEQMAKRLYDYWFIQFDFPGADGKSYKSNGGKMVWNKELKREIPEGWEVGVLSDVANITMGQSPEGSSYNECGEGIVFYQGSTDFGIRFPTVRMYTTAPTRYAKKRDILMSVRAPVGTLNIANSDCCIGRGLAALNSKLNSITHLWYMMDVFKHTFENKNGAGTTFGSITKDELYNLPVVIPTNKVIEQFTEKTLPIFDQQLLVAEENVKLTKLRDKLLPLLMNGQVVVG